jgi:hypothetical protein
MFEPVSAGLAERKLGNVPLQEFANWGTTETLRPSGHQSPGIESSCARVGLMYLDSYLAMSQDARFRRAR